MANIYTFEKPLNSECNNMCHMLIFVEIKNNNFWTFFRRSFWTEKFQVDWVDFYCKHQKTKLGSQVSVFKNCSRYWLRQKRHVGEAWTKQNQQAILLVQS